MNGISSVTDSPLPGQAHRVVTSQAIAAVEAIVKENCCVTVNEMETAWKNEVIVYRLCTVNYEIKIFKFLILLNLVYTSIYVYTHTHILIYMCIYIYMYIQCMYVCIYTHTYMCVYICMNMYTHI